MKVHEGTCTGAQQMWCLRCHKAVLVHPMDDVRCSCTRVRASNVKEIPFTEWVAMGPDRSKRVRVDRVKWEGEVEIPYWVDIDSEEARRDMDKIMEKLKNKKEAADEPQKNELTKTYPLQTATLTCFYCGKKITPPPIHYSTRIAYPICHECYLRFK